MFINETKETNLEICKKVIKDTALSDEAKVRIVQAMGKEEMVTNPYVYNYNDTEKTETLCEDN